jgi:hypothetical protein
MSLQNRAFLPSNLSSVQRVEDSESGAEGRGTGLCDHSTIWPPPQSVEGFGVKGLGFRFGLQASLANCLGYRLWALCLMV